jgi:hypothetical protein
MKYSITNRGIFMIMETKLNESNQFKCSINKKASL